MVGSHTGSGTSGFTYLNRTDRSPAWRTIPKKRSKKTVALNYWIINYWITENYWIIENFSSSIELLDCLSQLQLPYSTVNKDMKKMRFETIFPGKPWLLNVFLYVYCRKISGTRTIFRWRSSSKRVSSWRFHIFFYIYPNVGRKC